MNPLNNFATHIMPMSYFMFQQIELYDHDMTKFYDKVLAVEPDIKSYFFLDFSGEIINHGFVAISGSARARGTSRKLALSNLMSMTEMRN